MANYIKLEHMLVNVIISINIIEIYWFAPVLHVLNSGKHATIYYLAYTMLMNGSISNDIKYKHLDAPTAI